jgi:predicted 3-demethylubiquinone-9 3-methyltransferase (glyoxalase superfamily)
MKFAAKTLISCLWFDTQAEDAAKHYVSIFENARLGDVSRFPAEGQEIHGKPAGSVMTVEFEIGNNKFVALNGGPQFKFDEAISLQILCETQDEIDYFSSRLTEGGGRQGQCGWLKDKFGLSWQITAGALPRMLKDNDPAKTQRVMKAMMQMKKLDLAALNKAYAA